MRIPTLAIHLDRAVNSEGFKFNTELQLNPILATVLQDQRHTSDWVAPDEPHAEAMLFEVFREKRFGRRSHRITPSCA